ncbi:MAG TPA: transporter substrate-binding domain-containing protein [Azospirillaceae bacterium]|nr:transporter substrate-binding domain-containing protein [Azospirillaceae bacterium]
MRIPVLAAAVLALLPAAAAADTVTLRADNWCPYNCEPGSERPGYMVEVAKAVFEPLGHTVDYKTMPWTQALEEAREGRHAGVIGAIPDDAPGFVFGAEPLGQSTNVVAVRKGYGFAYKGVDSLKGHRLAAVQDYAYAPDLDAYIAEHAGKGGAVTLSSGDDVTADNLRKLLASQADLVLDEKNVLDYTAVQAGLEDVVQTVPLGSSAPLFIAFSPKHPKAKELAAALDAGVKEMRKSGKLAEILKRYGLKDWAGS